MEKFLVGFEDTAALAVPPEIYEVRQKIYADLLALIKIIGENRGAGLGCEPHSGMSRSQDG